MRPIPITPRVFPLNSTPFAYAFQTIKFESPSGMFLFESCKKRTQRINERKLILPLILMKTQAYWLRESAFGVVNAMLSIPTPPRPIIFNPGQASISLRTLVALLTKTTLMLFYLQISNLFLRYFCCYYFISTFSKAIIPLLEIPSFANTFFIFLYFRSKI
jgi:hypothetical protein